MPPTIDRTALLKIVLHAAKYPTSAVNGLLIGTVASQAVHVYDAIPVCHSFITLTPVLECALAQVSEHARQEGKGVRVVGYYQCNERLEDCELSGAGKKIADRIEQLHPDSVAVVLDSKALQRCLAGEEVGSLLALFLRDGARGWGPAPGAARQAASPAGGVKELLELFMGEGRHRRLADFEEHLADIKRDWLNPDLVA